MSDFDAALDVRDVTLKQVPGGVSRTVKISAATTFLEVVNAAGVAGQALYADGKAVTDLSAKIPGSVANLMSVAGTKGN